MNRPASLERGFHEVVKRRYPGCRFTANTLIAVDVLRQQLEFYEGRRLVAVYAVSTSANGVGCQADSGCTPSGWHVVRQKIGAGLPIGTVFRGRAPGEVTASLRNDTRNDLITSRILWLDGLEAGRNLGGDVDSFKRYIYIHGTAQEHLIGRAVSHGCIRMCNADVIALFDRVSIGTPVLISTDNN